MELLKANDIDTYTVEVTDPLPQKQFEFIDNIVLPRLPYYYGLGAAGLDARQATRVEIQPGTIAAMICTPPEPPVWDEENSGWVYVDDDGTVYEWDADLTGATNPLPAIRLVWLASYLVEHF